MLQRPITTSYNEEPRMIARLARFLRDEVGWQSVVKRE